MGYRSTFITDDWSFQFSNDFIEKYKDTYNFKEDMWLPISTKKEIKRFSDDIEKDIVAELKAKNENWRIFGVWLHEDGEMTKLIFTQNGVEEIEVI